MQVGYGLRGKFKEDSRSTREHFLLRRGVEKSLQPFASARESYYVHLSLQHWYLLMLKIK